MKFRKRGILEITYYDHFAFNDEEAINNPAILTAIGKFLKENGRYVYLIHESTIQGKEKNFGGNGILKDDIISVKHYTYDKEIYKQNGNKSKQYKK